jgi:hypothetical protein
VTRGRFERAAARAPVTAAVASAAASSSGGAAASAVLTNEAKKALVDDPSRQIPLLSMAAEFRLLSPACDIESGAKNCKHNVACLHGLGVHKKGIWDTKGSATTALLGVDPHLRARQVQSHVGLRNMGATLVHTRLLSLHPAVPMSAVG